MCSRPGKIGDQLGGMGEIVTFSKGFTKVDSNDDSLLTFQVGYSRTLDDTGRATGSMKIGTFPLHTATCLLHTNTFFSL